MYRHDPAGTGYSRLAQIDTRNVANVTRVWTYGLQSDAPAVPTGRGAGPGAANSEATPIVVNGVMYLPAAGRIVRFEAETGKEIWRHPVIGGAPSRRGVGYWPGEGHDAPRIIFAVGRRLIALNARTGAVEAGFGQNGEVDMGVPYNSVPLIHKNVCVLGSNSPQEATAATGHPPP